MSLSEELWRLFDSKADVLKCRVDKDAELHGEPAVEVTVTLADGREVVGTFTTEDRKSFGGVEFESRKDIPGLMAAKVRSVLAGKAEV